MSLALSLMSSEQKCSICWEDVSKSCGRSFVKLQCSHMFHLDCIGSAFNASGIMQCPNCRGIEHGVWRRFEDNPSPEGSIDQENLNENDRQLMEMPSSGQHLCPFHGGAGMLPSLGSQDMIEHHALFACNPNINHWSRQSMLTEISSTHVVHNLGQPGMFTSMNNHITDTNQPSPPATLRNAQTVPDGPTMESIGHRVILQPGGNGHVYEHFRHMQPLINNSPSPAVRTMLHRSRSGSNGLSGGGIPAGHSLPDQTANFICGPSFSITSQSLPHAAIHIHNHYQERCPIPPFDYTSDDMGPTWGLFNN